MLRFPSAPVLKPAAKMNGMGNLPSSTSRVAAIKPKVAAGRSIKAKKLPSTGTMERMDMLAMNMKNKPVSASGCFQKARMPWRTQSEPVFAGTTLSFIGQSVTGCATRWRNTRSKCVGSWGCNMLASRGRWKSHRREVQKRKAPARSMGLSN